jgi:hypothetical protein
MDAELRLDCMHCRPRRAPQELARILGEVIDHARQGQLAAERASPRSRSMPDG